MNASRALIVCAILIFVLSSKAIGQRRAVAIVERLSGTVFLKQDGNTKPLKLNAKSDLARPLYVGDALHCETGGKITVRIGSRVTELNEKSGWFIVSRPASAQSDRIQKAIAEYGRIGGRDKGGGPRVLVYSPTDEGVVTPETFVIRWVPLGKKCDASLVIKEPGDNELWRQDNVSGLAVSLDSASARQAISTYRSKVGEGTLFLKLTDSCGHADQSRFDVLSLEDEESLRKELAHWNDETGKMIAHLGRASVFTSYKMFPQAAQEYEAALALAPQSYDLLKKNVDAHRRCGNHARADQLEKRLLRSPGRGKNKPSQRP